MYVLICVFSPYVGFLFLSLLENFSLSFFSLIYMYICTYILICNYMYVLTGISSPINFSLALSLFLSLSWKIFSLFSFSPYIYIYMYIFTYAFLKEFSFFLSLSLSLFFLLFFLLFFPYI